MTRRLAGWFTILLLAVAAAIAATQMTVIDRAEPWPRLERLLYVVAS